MLDQNTDRMWYVIGAVIVGAAIILILNSTMPELFASVGNTFKSKTDETTSMIQKESSAPYGVNLLKDSNRVITTKDYKMESYDLYYSDLAVGEEMTVTIKGTLSEQKTAFGLYNSNGHGLNHLVAITHSAFNENGIAQLTFKWKNYDTTVDATNSNDHIEVYALNSAQYGGIDNVTSEIEWITVERGSGTPID